MHFFYIDIQVSVLLDLSPLAPELVSLGFEIVCEVVSPTVCDVKIALFEMDRRFLASRDLGWFLGDRWLVLG